MDFIDVVNFFENHELKDIHKEFLSSSMYYYCAGKDPSPIICSIRKFQLYIYVDSFVYMKEHYDDATNLLYLRLEKNNMICTSKKRLAKTGRIENFDNAELSLWTDVSGQSFYLLYIKADASVAFEEIYEDGRRRNYILPNAICNYKFENTHLLMRKIEEKV